MAERSYNQYCPVAEALDRVGDRWSLLIVRDLFGGAKRFSDLANGLPGIGTNILATRLKSLEGSGIIRRRTLPPPAASAVYELTADGKALEETVSALAHWGTGHLGTPREEQFVGDESLKLGLRGLFLRFYSASEPTPLSCEANVLVAGAVRCFRVGVCLRGMVQVTPCQEEFDAPAPEMVIHLCLETLFALAGGRETFAAARAKGMVRVEGDPDSINRLG